MTVRCKFGSNLVTPCHFNLYEAVSNEYRSV